jgi:hypothetical protein
MNSEYIIPKEQIIWMNKKYGGNLRTDAEIESALSLGERKAVLKEHILL